MEMVMKELKATYCTQIWAKRRATHAPVMAFLRGRHCSFPPFISYALITDIVASQRQNHLSLNARDRKKQAPLLFATVVSTLDRRTHM
jgi:hypothetical protein